MPDVLFGNGTAQDQFQRRIMHGWCSTRSEYCINAAAGTYVAGLFLQTAPNRHYARMGSFPIGPHKLGYNKYAALERYAFRNWWVIQPFNFSSRINNHLLLSLEFGRWSWHPRCGTSAGDGAVNTQC
jgi:hypothetical protein